MNFLSSRRVQSVLAAALIAAGITGISADTRAADPAPGPLTFIDTHAHPVRNVRRGTMLNADTVLRIMDAAGIAQTVFLPPPFSAAENRNYGLRELDSLTSGNPKRLAFVTGGDTLNPMVQTTPADNVSGSTRDVFVREAERIASSHAAGFGEFAAEHFSSGRGAQPYESVPPDHPLLLALADIAARTGMPIDLHMEAVTADMPTPDRLQGGPNATALHANIAALERLLTHNPEAKIVWAHAGWDLIGERTVDLMRTLLTQHPNLYMSVKIDRGGSPRTAPFDGDGKLRDGWLALLQDFPDRFLIGSDQFYDNDDTGRLDDARRFIDALPPALAHKIALDNPRRVYRGLGG